MSSRKIEIAQIQLTYPARARSAPVEALAGVSCTVAVGELVSIVGPSGCGKTSLLRILAGLEHATDGSFRIHTSDLQRPTVSMVFQQAGLFPWLTVEQNVAYGLQMRGLAKAQRLDIAQHWLRAMGLERFRTAYPAQLSGGMQQRVGLARAFAYNGEVLLMDEPFGALDAQTRLELQQVLLEQYEQADQTVLIVTHSIEEALTLSDRVLIMSARPGRILAEVAVPFARPRDAIALRSDPAFSALVADIWGVLRSEVERARTAELTAA
ncbi:MAG: ABC transporter ATP-binding protein [Chloroflexaceae bacterium]|nr:ABC transporter ATP-binding protein [Chloroflexaceae bacterium]